MNLLSFLSWIDEVSAKEIMDEFAPWYTYPPFR